MKHIDKTGLSTSLPNLDDMELDDLIAARVELKHVADGLLQMASYAEAKYDAQHHRLRGNIAVALKLEGHADRLYKQLPDWAKW